MKRLAPLALALLLASYVGVAAAAAPPKTLTCKAGAKRAVIGGRVQCLRIGLSCNARFNTGSRHTCGTASSAPRGSQAIRRLVPSRATGGGAEHVPGARSAAAGVDGTGVPSDRDVAVLRRVRISLSTLTRPSGATRTSPGYSELTAGRSSSLVRRGRGSPGAHLDHGLDTGQRLEIVVHGEARSRERRAGAEHGLRVSARQLGLVRRLPTCRLLPARRALAAEGSWSLVFSFGR